jgi:hypothetical protein
VIKRVIILPLQRRIDSDQGGIFMQLNAVLGAPGLFELVDGTQSKEDTHVIPELLFLLFGILGIRHGDLATVKCLIVN